jgi:glycosyltransferase involved in cell wall biosynthesis
MPRKRSDEIDVVLRLAASALEGWEVVPIDGMSQGEVANVLRRSAIFLSFSQHEGYAMPPLEALASGCFVMGFDGFGGREYFDPRFTLRIEDGDLVAFGDALAGWLGTYEWTSETERRAREASSFALSHYSPDREQKDIVAFYEHFLDRAANCWSSSHDSMVLHVPSLQSPRWRVAGSHAVAALRALVRSQSSS